MRHYFRVEVAKEVGVNAAVIYENIAFWVNHNAKRGKNLKDGEFWTYGTQKDIAAQFDYLSVKQVRTALEKLEEHGYIKTGCYNKHGYDRTTWFTITDKCKCQEGQKQMPEKANAEPVRAIGFAVDGATIPDNKTDIKTDIKHRAKELAAKCGAKYEVS